MGSPDFSKPLEKLAERAAQGDIPWMFVLLAFVILQFLLVKGVYRPWVDSKTEEIRRLVSDRDKLQDLVLNKRLHAEIDETGRSIKAVGTTKKNKGTRK